MHVAYIHQHFSTPKGATGTRSYEMSERLIAAGHRVTMICGDYAVGDRAASTGTGVSEYEVDGIHVVRIAEPYGNEMSFARRILAFGRFARRAAPLVAATKADLVFATSTPLTVGLPGKKAARELAVPFVFEVRDLWPELAIAMNVVRNPLLKWYTRRMERTIYAAADRIIALAPGIKEGVCKTGYPAARVDMIPNSADLDLFGPSDEPLDDDRFGSPDEFRLVFTGAHGLANGLIAVLAAAVELKRRGVAGIRFVFIGQGSQRERLIALANEQGLSDRISWVPSIPKEELAHVLPRFDVGMMILANIPSFYYGTSPNKFFDYIACGLPVLNNYPGWLAGMIEKHRCGIVVPPDDPKAFADAVLNLRDRRDELPKMGERSRQLAEAHFSRDRLGEAFVETLQRAHDSSMK